MKFVFLFILTISCCGTAQNIENAKVLDQFKNKIEENKEVTNILFLGDSHIQSGWIPGFLRSKFQEKYGNAGRGLVFPYQIANSNGPDDFNSTSNKAWQTFRLVYDQDIFDNMGALGFVMGNHDDSFIEIQLQNPNDLFDEVKIYHHPNMDGEIVTLYNNPLQLKDFVTYKKTQFNYTVEKGETYPELAAKFNVVTTRLLQLNGKSITTPQEGQVFKVEKSEPQFDSLIYEQNLKKIVDVQLKGNETVINLPKKSQQLLLRSNAKSGNIFYGFQLLDKEAKNGVVFNSVGVNGATYADYLKFPLQMEQLKNTSPDLVVISLGTNEGVSAITKADFQKNVKNLIENLRQDHPNFPILLISPTDNNMNGKKTAEVVDWISESAVQNNTAFLNMYKATGGKGYFSKSLQQKKANTDGVHFLQSGYQDQAQKIWDAFNIYLSN